MGGVFFDVLTSCPFRLRAVAVIGGVHDIGRVVGDSFQIGEDIDKQHSGFRGALQGVQPFHMVGAGATTSWSISSSSSMICVDKVLSLLAEEESQRLVHDFQHPAAHVPHLGNGVSGKGTPFSKFWEYSGCFPHGRRYAPDRSPHGTWSRSSGYPPPTAPWRGFSPDSL